MPELQLRAIAVAEVAFGIRSMLGTAPHWLARPGRAECGPLWNVVSDIYARLTNGLRLPDVMPPRERRSLDALMSDASGLTHVLEIDEKQHFNAYRAQSLSLYPPDAPVAFPTDAWIEASMAKKRLEGGGFARARPPLFDLDNGRHRQRAFRDALADLLPPVHGWAPTIRIAQFEFEPWIWSADAEVHFGNKFAERFGLAPDRSSRPAAELVQKPRHPIRPTRRTGAGQTQPVTPSDLAGGRVRIPAATKAMFPSSRTTVSIMVRGVRMTVPYDPRNGPDRSRSGVLRIGRGPLSGSVTAYEQLTVSQRDGVFHLE